MRDRIHARQESALSAGILLIVTGVMMGMTAEWLNSPGAMPPIEAVIRDVVAAEVRQAVVEARQ